MAAVQEQLVVDVLARLEAMRAAGDLPGIVAVTRLHVPIPPEDFSRITQPSLMATDYGEQESDVGQSSESDWWERTVVVLFFWKDSVDGALAADLHQTRETVFRGLSGWRPPNVVVAGPATIRPRQIVASAPGGTEQFFGGCVAAFVCKEPRGWTA